MCLVYKWDDYLERYVGPYEIIREATNEDWYGIANIAPYEGKHFVARKLSDGNLYIIDGGALKKVEEN